MPRMSFCKLFSHLVKKHLILNRYCHIFRHMRLMHPKVFKKSDKLFACDQCDEKFDMSYKLKNHMATSTHGKAYLCTKCNQNFSTANPSDYIKHYQDTHGGLPPDFLDKETFVCDQCPRVFIAKGGLISESIFSSVKASILNT